MVSRDDLHNFQTGVLKKTKVCIDESIAPVKNDLHDLKNRVVHHENNPSSGGSSKDAVIDHLQKQLEKLDPAKKRAVFIGYWVSIVIIIKKNKKKERVGATLFQRKTG